MNNDVCILVHKLLVLLAKTITLSMNRYLLTISQSHVRMVLDYSRVAFGKRVDSLPEQFAHCQRF